MSLTIPVSRRRLVGAGCAGVALAPVLGLLGGCAPTAGRSVGGAAAGASGDAFELLTADHRRVDGLFQQALGTSNGEAERRAQLLVQLKTALTRHALAEENVVYPTLRVRTAGDPEASELYRDHADVKTHLFVLEQSPKGTDAWLARMREFQQDVLRHVAAEENEVFPRMRASLSAAQLAEMTQLVTREMALV